MLQSMFSDNCKGTLHCYEDVQVLLILMLLIMMSCYDVKCSTLMKDNGVL